MRILQINNCHYRRGGADVVYLNTSELLSKNGNEVFCLSQKNEKNIIHFSNKYFVDQVDFFNNTVWKRITQIPRFFYSANSAKNIESLISNHKPDIAHFHTYKGTITPSVLGVLKKHKIPVVISLHDYGFLCPHNLFLDGKLNICEKCINSSSINCVINKCNRNSILLSSISEIEFKYHKSFFPFEKYFDTLIAVSKFGESIHNKSTKLAGKIKHLYNFYPNLSETKINNVKGTYFLYFGRLSKEKGVKTLIESWIKKERRSQLKIVGEGELFKELISKYAVLPGIEFLGFKQGDELQYLIRQASFVIVPSEWYENNPLTVIEAYANGKPVIGANVGGIPEIVKHNETGYLFEMKNVNDLSEKISKADEMSDIEYSQFSKNARKFAELNFGEEVHYSGLIEIYKDTIKKYSSGN